MAFANLSRKYLSFFWLARTENSVKTVYDDFRWMGFENSLQHRQHDVDILNNKYRLEIHHSSINTTIMNEN